MWGFLCRPLIDFYRGYIRRHRVNVDRVQLAYKREQEEREQKRREEKVNELQALTAAA